MLEKIRKKVTSLFSPTVLDPIREKQAIATSSSKFISVWTYSAYRMGQPDPLYAPVDISVSSLDDALGQAIVSALDKTRFFSLKQAEEIRDESSNHYNRCIEQQVKKYGYRSRRALFKDMKSCSISQADGIIMIVPSHYEGLEEYSNRGIADEQHLKIPAISTHGEIGTALRLAFSRCT
ncbi:MAG: contact-dependent growth inhibition system immunity protein [Steroidobacteraceae bacterium]